VQTLGIKTAFLIRQGGCDGESAKVGLKTL